MNSTHKLVSALNASLAVVIAYLLSMYLGMDSDATTAATTIMLIATAESFKSSLQRGMYRVLGSLLGGAIGMTLIALFPQERMMYLLSLSVFVTLLMYLARAYRGDKTIFMLAAVTMMMVFKEGAVDDVFLYGINRIVMTVFGIVVYTAVVVYVFPKLAGATVQEEEEKESEFVWFDIEDIQASFVSFLIFWIGIYIWIEYNPPQGFLIVALATTLSLYTSFSLISPMALIVLFSFSFIFAIFSYIFILPNLGTVWELGIFLFIYSFIGFYFFKPEISIFFLLGITTFFIQNEMFYNFQLFLIVLLIFYMFLFLLLLFDYIPFNTQPQYMFLKLLRRFFRLSESILKNDILSPYAKYIFKKVLDKIEVYMNAIDYKFYRIATKEEMERFVQECKEFAHKLDDFIENGAQVAPKELLLQYKELSQREFDFLKESRF